MSTLGFVLFGSNQLNCADHCLKYVRKFYPIEYVLIVSDNGADYSELSRKYNTEYLYCTKKLGYPKQPYGYRKESVIEFLDRFYIACLRTNTTHLMNLEEDNVVMKRLEISDGIEVAGWKPCNDDGTPFSNGFPNRFIDILTKQSGVRPNVPGYGAGGGTVLKVSTFLKNYERIKSFVEINLDFIQDNIYPTAGWIDCFFTWVYMLCGKPYTYNTNLMQIHIQKESDFIPENIPQNIEVVHGYKFYSSDWNK